MITIKRLVGRGGRIAAVLAFGVALVAPALASTQQAYAAGTLTSRKVTVASSASGSISTGAAGSGTNGAQTSHTFTFTPSASTIGSIAFMYCTTPFVNSTCTAPTGMDASTVSAVTESLSGAYSIATGQSLTTGWFSGQSCTTANCIVIKAASATAETATPKTVTFGASGGWIKNPTVNNDYYVRIITFSDTAFTTEVDEGATMFAITDEINITAKVQEKLNFSVANAPKDPSPGCAALDAGGAIDMGDPVNHVLDSGTAYDAHSYFRVSTNSANGTVIQYSGDTLKAGSTAINAPTTATASTIGTEQFGLGLDSGDATPFGYSMTNLTQFASNYNLANGTITGATPSAKFLFSTASVTSPVTLVSSPGIITCDTGSVRYIANISTTTKPGIYKTSIAYIATPTY